MNVAMQTEAPERALRFALAMFHGIDVAKWPAGVREMLGPASDASIDGRVEG